MDNLKCSFCQRNDNEVENLIKGSSNIYICDKCIHISYNQIHPREFPSRNNDEVQIDILKETLYRVVLQGPLRNDHFKEICRWTEETLLSYVCMNVNQRSIDFIFLKEGDAIAFKLRWT